MQKRRFGRTGHMSTVAIFGGAALWEATQEETDRTMEIVLDAGVNHVDVAPQYGYAEERLGPWMARERENFFLGCKTMERTQAAALAEIKRSLRRLQVSNFDLYQIHAITSMEELDKVTKQGGALEAIIDARDKGYTRFIGITGHGFNCPEIFIEALSRFDFDSVLFPINFIQYGNPTYRENCTSLLRLCRQRDVGTMIIKTITKGPWDDKKRKYITWYEPFDENENIQKAVDFALSQDVTGLCTAGDMRILPKILEACENFTYMAASEQEALIGLTEQYKPLFPEPA